METTDHKQPCACGNCRKQRRDAALDAAKEQPNARRSAAACSPDDLRVRDAFAVEVFITDNDGQRWSGSNFANIELAKSWITMQPNRDRLRVALTAKFILENH